MKAESHFQLGNIFYESEFTNYNDPSEFFSTHCNLFATASSQSKLSKSSETSEEKVVNVFNLSYLIISKTLLTR